MSEPISNFSHLSISPSMETSGQRTRQPPQDEPHYYSENDMSGSDESEEDEGEDKDEDAEEDEDEDEDEEADDETTVFAVEFCTSSADHFIFQVVAADIERNELHISRDRSPLCSCEEGRRQCQHKVWFIDQMQKMKRQGDTFYKHIDNISLSRLADRMHWEYVEDPTDAPTSEWELKKQNPRFPGRDQKREDIVRDIMATLSPSIAEEYRTDIFGHDFSDDDILVPRDLEATLCRLLLRDDDVLYRFKTLVPREEQTLDYFYKRGAKAEHTFKLYDEYVQRGPSNREGEGEHDPTWCAKVLFDIVNSIVNATFTPLDLKSSKKAAQVLKMILQEVVQHNFDISKRVTWNYIPRPGETEVNRNLYALLISSKSNFNTKGYLLVDAFHNIGNAAVDVVDELAAIRDEIGDDATPEFVKKLNERITLLKGSVASKRSGEGMERPHKRLMK